MTVTYLTPAAPRPEAFHGASCVTFSPTQLGGLVRVMRWPDGRVALYVTCGERGCETKLTPDEVTALVAALTTGKRVPP